MTNTIKRFGVLTVATFLTLLAAAPLAFMSEPPPTVSHMEDAPCYVTHDCPMIQHYYIPIHTETFSDVGQ